MPLSGRAFCYLARVVSMGLLFSAIVIFAVRKIVDPLKKLTDASKKLSNGNYDVEIVHSDESGTGVKQV